MVHLELAKAIDDDRARELVAQRHQRLVEAARRSRRPTLVRGIAARLGARARTALSLGPRSSPCTGRAVAAQPR